MCDCNIVFVIRHLNLPSEYYRLPDMDKIRCKKPKKFFWKRLIDLEENDVCPQKGKLIYLNDFILSYDCATL